MDSSSTQLLFLVLALALVGCPSKTTAPTLPSDTPSAPAEPPASAEVVPSPAPHPTAGPVSQTQHKLPRTDPAGTKEAEAWDALDARVGQWTRLLPGLVKAEASRATLEAPLRGDSSPIQRLALLARHLPMEDPKAKRVLNIVGPLRRIVEREKGLDPGLFDPKQVRAIVWIGLMDPRVVLRLRLLKTGEGWVSPEDVGRGAFDLEHARALRECIGLAHAGDWTQTTPRYTQTLIALAKSNSAAQGQASLEAWKDVDAAWAGDLVALEEALDRWWRTFVGSK